MFLPLFKQSKSVLKAPSLSASDLFCQQESTVFYFRAETHLVGPILHIFATDCCISWVAGPKKRFARALLGSARLGSARFYSSITEINLFKRPGLFFSPSASISFILLGCKGNEDV